MGKLAIKGDRERNGEVMSILKMLGGKWSPCNGDNDSGYYYVNEKYENKIMFEAFEDNVDDKEFTILSVDDFNQKYPYRVSDVVMVDNNEGFIIDLKWLDSQDCIKYKLFFKSGSQINGWYHTSEFNTVNEEKDMLSFEYNRKDDVFELIIPNNMEIITDKGRVFYKRKEIVFPNTYEECISVLGYTEEMLLKNNILMSYKVPFLSYLQCLLVARDAYWKLWNNWKPDWTNYDERKYCISIDKNNIIKKCYITGNKVLVFPTEEMRDIFLENFKDDIELCKDLL